MSYYKKHGFTLMELIIVIAVLGILASIAIPTYSKFMDKSRAGVCSSNRQELMHLIEAELAADDYTTPQEAYDSLIDKNNSKSICPSGGEISLKCNADGSFQLTCSKHSEVTVNLGDADTMGAVIQTMKSASSSVLDSGAILVSSTCESAKTVAQLKKQGIDLDDLNAKSWCYKDNKFYWSTVDISTMKNGDRVPVIQYNPSSNNYTVWIATISDKGKTGSSDKNYNVLQSYSQYKPSTIDDKGNQTYEQALKRLQEATNNN